MPAHPDEKIRAAVTAIAPRRNASLFAALPPFHAEGPSIRHAFLLLVALLPAVLDRTGHGDLTYVQAGLAEVLAACFCLGAGQRFPREKQPWRILSLALAVHSLPYLAATSRQLGWLSAAASAWVGNFGNAAGMVLLIPALIGTWTVRKRAVQVFDLLLVSLTVLLTMATYGSGADPGEGAVRVWTGIGLLAVITLLAFLLRFAGARPGLRSFRSIVLRFLLWDLLDMTLINVVIPRYFPHTRDIVVDLLIPLPEILLCEWVMTRNASRTLRWFRLNRTAVDSMQPALFTMLSVLTALYAFRHLPLWAGVSVIAVVLCFALRTQIYYAELFKERSRLLSRVTEYHRLATRDPLTGIGNRRWFEANLEAAISNPDSFPCALLLIDVDHFKHVNDSHGHDAGDAVLCAIASILGREVQSMRQACIARIGGDEFAILLRDVDHGTAQATAERIRRSVQRFGASKGYPVTVSVGGETVQRTIARTELLAAADAALYRAKAAGRNAVEGLVRAG